MSARTRSRQPHAAETLEKCPTGIQGLDEITYGGLPRGRPTLVCGAAGCGKTLLATEFLVRGAQRYGESGVFMSFEETPDELAKNVASLGFDLKKLIASKQLAIDYVRVERGEIEETGEYDLEGLFIRLDLAIRTVGAKRVVLDTLEALFGGMANDAILRSELSRLFHWLKDRGVTAVITAERGDGTLTRHGLEEYVSDCVILLDNRIQEQIATRRIRVVKYRGSTHGSNEYPFLIGNDGISVFPITSVALEHEVSNERISTGIADLDAMLGSEGYYRGSSVLISGTAGTGKSSLAAHFVNAACQRGERCYFFAFEESEQQILRNMRSIGLDLKRWVDRGLLRFYTARATMYGLETHLALMHKLITEFNPQVVVADPINTFASVGTNVESKAMLVRLIDFLKSRKVTTLFTNLTSHEAGSVDTDVGISSIMDTWLSLRNLEYSGESNRVLYVLKSRGMAHSNQVREFLITTRGIELRTVYIGAGGVLTGSARVAQEAQERAAELAAQQESAQKTFVLEHKRKALEARIALMRAEFEAEAEEVQETIDQDQVRQQQWSAGRADVARSRGMNGDSYVTKTGGANETRH